MISYSKLLKFLFFISISLILLLIGLRYYIRKPSYTIQTFGKLYIVNKLSKDITVFDLYKGKKIAEIPINIESHQVAKLKDRDKIVVANYDSFKNQDINLTIINTQTNKIEKTIKFNQTNIDADGVLALTDFNKIGIVSRNTNEFLVVNLDSELIENKIATQQKSSHFAIMHPTKPLTYITNQDSGTVSVIDLTLNKVIKIIACGAGSGGIVITPDGNEIWVANKDKNSISIIATSTNEVIETLKSDDEPLNLVFSIDGKYCLVPNGNDGTIAVLNRETRQQVKIIRIPGKKELLERILYHTPRPVTIIMHPSGKYAFVSNSNANKIEVIDMKTFAIVSTIGTGKIPDGLIFIN
ncbi:YVTN family beta-propeller protein [Flavobacterium sp. PL11]|uniref:YncE family protein n=1 Tax=Flavobacterium sp. PL11 TaxID=3071717 RepID=UPI002E0B0BC7|nr:YVTN family beta-propeller protein [Flavobacterium sp. PL11]